MAENFFAGYSSRLINVLEQSSWENVARLASEVERCWLEKKQVFICGNGGSAGNAIHLANDYIYGIAKQMGAGLKVHALSANPAVITCLANDTGYERIYSEQLAVLGHKGDVLIVLSGSGNSANIVAAIEQARKQGLVSCAILGFDGGKCLEISDIPIHFPVNDMQISEDMQLIVGHMLMQWLYKNRSKISVEEGVQ